MSYTTGTTHYNLPLTTNNDKRDWADTNQAFTDVDAALYGAVSNTSTQGEEITALDTRLTTAEGNISTNAGNITALDTRLTTAEGTITSQGTQISDVRSDAEDMICAYNEATATSTHAYSIGAYFIYNDVLYRATASISIGDTIVPDINCTTTNVTTELATAGNYAVDMICIIVENTTTSTHNYNVGDYFLLEKTLYKVTASISVGTTIIPDTNCVSTNTCAELSTLNSEVTSLNTELTNQTITATGAPVNVRYVRYGNVVTCESIGTAKMNMTAGTVYPVNVTMQWPPAYPLGFEILCRNGVEAYFALDASAGNQFTITPRSDITQDQSMGFIFTYLAEPLS